MDLYHMTTSANQNSFRYHETKQPCGQVLHQNTKISLVCKQTGLYIYIRRGFVVNGLYVFFYLKNQFYVFQTTPTVDYILTWVFTLENHCTRTAQSSRGDGSQRVH